MMLSLFLLYRLLVIAEGQPPEVLTKMNSVIRRIDLTCKLLAPVITGFIISFVSLKASAITLALWNTVSVWVEYWLFTSVYNGIPALGQSSQRRMARLSQSDQQKDNPTLEEDSLLSVAGGSAELVDRKSSKRLCEKISEIPYVAAWKVYLKQEIALPGLALALLFFTVLRWKPTKKSVASKCYMKKKWLARISLSHKCLKYPVYLRSLSKTCPALFCCLSGMKSYYNQDKTIFSVLYYSKSHW